MLSAVCLCERRECVALQAPAEGNEVGALGSILAWADAAVGMGGASMLAGRADGGAYVEVRVLQCLALSARNSSVKPVNRCIRF